jgi:ring-1,2-phenylacetyl-CoA epoxidase subunit PaaD
LVTIAISKEQVLDWLSEVADPEIPVLTITDLGIVRGVRVDEGVTVALTPTYSGCPATEVIEQSVVDALGRQGVEGVRIERVLSPPWTTDWISDEGRAKLKAYGIAPPAEGGSKRELLQGRRQIACPRCESVDTALVSEFGSTACKASYKCNACLEPFEYFKCI